MDGGGAAADGAGPGDWFRERPVDFEDTGAIGEARQAAQVAGGELFGCDLNGLAGSEVEQDGFGGGQAVEGVDAVAGFDDAAQGAEIGRESVGDLLRTAAWHRPSARVSGGGEHQTDGRGGRLIERDDGVGGEAGEEGPGGGGAKGGAGQRAGGPESAEAEAGEGKRVGGEVQRSREDFRRQLVPVANQRGEEGAIRGGVVSKGGARFLHAACESGGGGVIERMCDGDGRVDPLQTVVRKRERAEERRRQRHGMHGGTDVMQVPGQRQFERSSTAADGLVRFADQHRQTGAGQHDGSGEAVRTRTYYDGVVLGHAWFNAMAASAIQAAPCR